MNLFPSMFPWEFASTSFPSVPWIRELINLFWGYDIYVILGVPGMWCEFPVF